MHAAISWFLSDSLPTDIVRNAPESPADPKADESIGPTVRFKSTVQEIDPQQSSTFSDDSTLSNNDPAAEVTPEEIRALSKSLQANRLQERRMNIFSFEPYSLPASRVCLTRPCLENIHEPATLVPPVSSPPPSAHNSFLFPPIPTILQRPSRRAWRPSPL